MDSSILFHRGRDGHGVIPLLVAKGYEPLDIRRGAETVLGKGNWGMGRPLGSAAQQDGAPGAPVRAMSAVGLVQRRLGMGQAQAGDTVKVMIQQFDWSRADLANCSHYEFNM